MPLRQGGGQPNGHPRGVQALRETRGRPESFIYTDPYRYKTVYMCRGSPRPSTLQANDMPTSGLKPHWFHILLSIADQPLHGTAVMEEVLERTDGELRLWPGKLYGSFKELTERGWVEEVDPPAHAPTEGGKRRFYAVTRTGRMVLHEEVERLASFVRVARAKRVGSDLENA